MHEPDETTRGLLPAATLAGHAAHTVQFYESDHFLADAVAEFLAAGIEAGQALVVIATGPHLEAFTLRLACQGFQLPDLCRSGRLVLCDAREILAGFMTGPMPDAQLFERTIGPIIEQAAASSNHRVVRAYGEMVDVLLRDGMPLAAVRLEELWNDLAGRRALSLLCAYNMGNFGKEADGHLFEEICHRHNVVGPSEQYGHLDPAARPVEIARLQQRALMLESEITHRQRLESSLRDALAQARRAEMSSLQLAAIVEHSADAIVSKDLDGVVQSWNRAAERMFGYSAAEMIGQSIRRLIPDDRQSEEDEVLARVRRGEIVDHYETVRRHKDGTNVAISLTVSPIRDRDGRIVGASKIARDITERIHMEAERDDLLARERAARREAEEVNRVKDEFLAVLSHELRTPLNAILGWTQTVRSWQSDPSTMRHAIEVIDRNARTQARLIEDLLDVSRIVSGKLQMTFDRVDLANVLSAAVDSVRPSAAANGVLLEAFVGDGEEWLFADAHRLQQVIGNVLSNAVKFTPEGGRVHVRLDRGAPDHRIVVSDTGQGIPATFLPYVFDRFRQADGSAARQHGGLGLGLAVARYIVEAHGGRIAAESPGEGLGSTFTIALPATLPSGLDQTPALPASPVAGDLHNVRLLVVDDDVDGRRLLQRVLEHAGASVDVVPSAPDALRAIERRRFDAVLADLGMPGTDGFELIRALRSHRQAGIRDIAAIAVTAYATDHARTKALALGYDAYVTKPVNDDGIVGAIVGVLSSRPAANPSGVQPVGSVVQAGL
jgi:PAS domain S-box-containing protein